jgi:hypothetical protein
VFVPIATCSPFHEGLASSQDLGGVDLDDDLPLEVPARVEAEVRVGGSGKAIVAYDALGEEVFGACRDVVHPHRLAQRPDRADAKLGAGLRHLAQQRPFERARLWVQVAVGADELVAQHQVGRLEGAVFRARHVLPAAVGQEAVHATRDKLGAVGQHHRLRLLDARPLVEHLRDGVPALGAFLDRAVDRVADLDVGDAPALAVGHQDPRVGPQAVDTGVAAAPIGVDRPAKRHPRARRHPVEDRAGFDLVEARLQRLGRVEVADHRLVAVARQRPLLLRDLRQVAPAHEHMFA